MPVPPQRLSFRIETDGDTQVIRWLGPLQESAGAALDALLEKISGKCRFHLAAVNWVNSLGISALVRFLRKARERATSITFAECPPVFVDCVNMMTSLTDGIHVASVYVPVSCAACGRQIEWLVEEHDFDAPERALKAASCTGCGKEGLDSIEYLHEYFAFHRPTPKA